MKKCGYLFYSIFIIGNILMILKFFLYLVYGLVRYSKILCRHAILNMQDQVSFYSVSQCLDVFMCDPRNCFIHHVLDMFLLMSIHLEDNI